MNDAGVLGVDYQPRRAALYEWEQFDTSEVREDFELLRAIDLRHGVGCDRQVMRLGHNTRRHEASPLTADNLPEAIARSSLRSSDTGRTWPNNHYTGASRAAKLIFWRRRAGCGLEEERE